MRPPQVCNHYGGRFGVMTHRWWGSKFCKMTCKDAYLRELALGRDKIRRGSGFLRGGRFQPSLPPRAAQAAPGRMGLPPKWAA
jgi:hypothetical protein